MILKKLENMFGMTYRMNQKTVHENVEKCFGKIGFYKLSLAFSDKDELSGEYVDTTKQNFKNVLTYHVIGLHRLPVMRKRFPTRGPRF